MRLQEARVILPKNAKGHGFLQERLVDGFGGFTETEGRGGWKAPDGRIVTEQVRVYDVAIPAEGHEGRDAEAQLLVLASELQKVSGEEAIYVRLPVGGVRFVEK